MSQGRRVAILLLVAVLLAAGGWKYGGLSQALHGLGGTDPLPSPEPAAMPSELAKPAWRVLFVGNSFTAANTLPRLVANLAAAAGEKRRLEYRAETPGGYTLKRHLDDGRVTALLRGERWDRVVLQDQSQVPSLGEDHLRNYMYPAARSLDHAIHDAGATTVFFMTWGYRQGDQHHPQDSYAAMQARLAYGYGGIARELSAELAPVGLAWQQALASRPQAGLWSGDGMHPSLAGSYLAACVLYGVLFSTTPSRIPYTAGLEESEARFLQETAASTLRTEGVRAH